MQSKLITHFKKYIILYLTFILILSFSIIKIQGPTIAYHQDNKESGCFITPSTPVVQQFNAETSGYPDYLIILIDNRSIEPDEQIEISIWDKELKNQLAKSLFNSPNPKWDMVEFENGHWLIKGEQYYILFKHLGGGDGKVGWLLTSYDETRTRRPLFVGKTLIKEFELSGRLMVRKHIGQSLLLIIMLSSLIGIIMRLLASWKVSSSYLPEISIAISFLLAFLCFNAPYDDKFSYSPFRGSIDIADDAGYYSYCRSLLIEGDIDFSNEKNYQYWNSKTSTGLAYNFWAIGGPLLWMPFFLTGHIIANISSAIVDGSNFNLQGYSAFHYTLTAIGSMIFGLIGLFLCFKFLKQFFSPWLSAIAIILIFWATPYPHYFFRRVLMVHSTELFTASLFLLLWLRFHNNPNLRNSSFLGISMGLLGLTRWPNIYYFILPLVSAVHHIYSYNKKMTVQELKIIIRNILGLVLIAYFIAFLFGLIQMFAWKIIYGKFIPIGIYPFPGNEEYSVYAFEKITWEKVSRFLFGAQWGWVWYTPLQIISILGLLLNIKKRPFWNIIFIILFIYPLYIVLHHKTNGSSFGYRYLLSYSPIFAFGIAQIIEKASKYRWSQLLVGLSSISMVIWNWMCLNQYNFFYIWNDPQFILKCWKNFLHKGLFLPGWAFRDHNFLFDLVLNTQTITLKLPDNFWNLETLWYYISAPIILLFSVIITLIGFIFFSYKATPKLRRKAGQVLLFILIVSFGLILSLLISIYLGTKYI